MLDRMLPPVAGLLAILWAGPAVAQSQAPVQGDSVFVPVRGADLEWSPITPEGFEEGIEIAVVRGDPGMSDEPYVIRLRFPDEYQFPPHWHPVNENVTVLKGTFLLGMGERRDKRQIKRYEPGDYLFIEAQHPHFGGARGQTVIQLHGPGPFEIITVGTPKDNRRLEAAAAR